MLAAVVLLLMQADAPIGVITRLAASEAIEYGIDTRLKLAETLAPKYPKQATQQLRDAEAVLPGVTDGAAQNVWRTRLVGALAPLDFEEAERLAKLITVDRKNDPLAEAYDLLYSHLGQRDRDEFIRTAIGAGAFRLKCAARRLAELKTSAPDDALALFSALLLTFPDSPDKSDVEYLEERAREMQAIDSVSTTTALKKAGAARDLLMKQEAPEKRSEKKDDSDERAPNLSKLPYADALEQASKPTNAVTRASALIDLSRREDLTRQQQARVAAEALSAVGQIKLGEDRLTGLAMLSRDFAKRHEWASAALAAQLLNESFTKLCDCGSQCNITVSECVNLMNDFAEYLDEFGFTQESLGLKNISLEVRLLILKLKRRPDTK